MLYREDDCLYQIHFYKDRNGVQPVKSISAILKAKTAKTQESKLNRLLLTFSCSLIRASHLAQTS